MLRILPYCPTSHELLRSDCSECGAQLRWIHSVGIGECESCEQVVAPSDAPLLEERLRPGYEFFARLIDTRPTVSGAAVAELGKDFDQADGAILVRMILGLGAWVHLEERSIGRKAIYTLPPSTLASVISTGAEMLRDWPRRLRSWAQREAVAHAQDEPGSALLRESLRKLGHRPTAGTVQADLIRSALPDLFRNVRRRFAPPAGTLFLYEAGEALGIKERLVELVDEGLLEAEVLASTKSRRLRFSRTIVEDLKARIADSISFPLLSRMTYLPIYAVENLCDHGLLEREAHPAIAYLRHVPSVTSSSVDRLRAAFVRSGAADPPEDAIPLGTAVRRIGGRLKPWTAMASALLDGSLACWKEPNANTGTPWLRSTLVREADLLRFDEVPLEAPSGAACVPPDECSLSDAKEILNLDGILSVRLQEVFASEIAVREQRGPKKAIPMEVVLARAEAEISMAEICARAGWNARKAKWALRSFEADRTPCGWRRSVIEQSGILTVQIDWTVRAHCRQAAALLTR